MESCHVTGTDKPCVMGSETPLGSVLLLFKVGSCTAHEPAQFVIGNGSDMCDPVTLMGLCLRVRGSTLHRKWNAAPDWAPSKLPEKCPAKPAE